MGSVAWVAGSIGRPDVDGGIGDGRGRRAGKEDKESVRGQWLHLQRKDAAAWFGASPFYVFVLDQSQLLSSAGVTSHCDPLPPFL